MIETPLEAIQWLTRRAKRVQYGADVYTDIANIIRKLNQDRIALRKEIARLQPPPPKVKERVPFEVEGTDQWNLT